MSCWVSKICQSEKEGQFFNLKFWPYLHIVMNKESKFIKSNCITCQVSYTFHYFKFCLLCPYLSVILWNFSWIQRHVQVSLNKISTFRSDHKHVLLFMSLLKIYPFCETFQLKSCYEISNEMNLYHLLLLIYRQKKYLIKWEELTRNYMQLIDIYISNKSILNNFSHSYWQYIPNQHMRCSCIYFFSSRAS